MKALKLSIFILFLLMLIALIWEKAIFAKESFVHDHIGSVRRNGDVLRILIDREFYDSKSAIFSHQTQIRTKKTELYVAEEKIRELMVSSEKVKFEKVGELKGRTELAFLEFFTIQKEHDSIATAARNENINKEDLCSYYNGECSYEFISEKDFQGVIDDSYKFQNKFIFDGEIVDLKLVENNNGLNSIEMYIDHNLKHRFEYYRYAHSDKIFDLRIFVEKE